MKILIFAHRLEHGGTQVNAIELASALRDLHGHDVLIFASSGPMLDLVEEKGLRYERAPDARFHPSPSRSRALRQLVRRERPDVIHVWDWWQCLDAYFAVHLPLRIPMVVTDMMMDLTRVLPRRLHTTFGTPQLVERARMAGRRRAHLMLPPVDVQKNAPGAVDEEPFRRKQQLKAGELTLITVSRLSMHMKSESLLRTIEAVRQIGSSLPVRFIIVGDGAAHGRLQALADEVNTELGREAVTLAGAMTDPRSAYAAADIVIGMGGSALRAMAFAKPVIIVGERGFASTFDEGTAPLFHFQGMYGRGSGDPGNTALIAEVRRLAGQPELLPVLGTFAREFVKEHHSLEAVSSELDALCRAAQQENPSLWMSTLDAMRTVHVYMRERRFLTPSADPAPKHAVTPAASAGAGGGASQGP